MCMLQTHPKGRHNIFRKIDTQTYKFVLNSFQN